MYIHARLIHTHYRPRGESARVELPMKQPRPLARVPLLLPLRRPSTRALLPSLRPLFPPYRSLPLWASSPPRPPGPDRPGSATRLPLAGFALPRASAERTWLRLFTPISLSCARPSVCSAMAIWSPSSAMGPSSRCATSPTLTTPLSSS